MESFFVSSLMGSVSSSVGHLQDMPVEEHFSEFSGRFSAFLAGLDVADVFVSSSSCGAAWVCWKVNRVEPMLGLVPGGSCSLISVHSLPLLQDGGRFSICFQLFLPGFGLSQFEHLHALVPRGL